MSPISEIVLNTDLPITDTNLPITLKKFYRKHIQGKNKTFN